MSKLKTRIAAGATIVGLGGLAGVALSAGEPYPSAAAAEKPAVRTKVVRRTVHVTKHAKPKPPAAAAAPTSAAATEYESEDGEHEVEYEHEGEYESEGGDDD